MTTSTWKVRAAVALVLMAGSGTPPLRAQEIRTVRGTVVDRVTGEPVEGVLVRVSDSEGAAFTDAAGGFVLERAPPGPLTFVLQRIGYGVSEVEVDPPEGEPLVIALEPAPVELPGLDAEARSFEARLDSIDAFMDRNAFGRYWGAGSDMPRVANLERMREFHDLDDPELALWALRVTPAMDFDCSVVAYGSAAHRVSGSLERRTFPTLVSIDGVEWRIPGIGCDKLRAMDTSSICRMELFHVPAIHLPDHRIRVWTCAFLARVALSGEPIPERMRAELLWPDFMPPGG